MFQLTYSEASRFKVRSSLSFSNLEVSEMISSMALLQSFRSKMTTPFPLPGFVITMSLFLGDLRKNKDTNNPLQKKPLT